MENRPNPFAFPQAANIVARNAFNAQIEQGRHEVPVNWEPLDENVPDAEYTAAIPLMIRNFATDRIRLLIGTQYVDVATEFFKGLALARHTNNPVSLIRDMVLSVYVAYTISRDWAAAYTAFGGDSIFAKFDIQGRQAQNGARDAWVANNNMNATAIHLLGFLIVECAPPGSLLNDLKIMKGTPFSPPAALEGNEQNRIMRQAAALISAADRAALNSFRAHSTKAIAVLSGIFGAARVDIEIAITAANSYAGTKI